MQAGASATGAIRELSEALASGPFRIALLLSVVVHAALLLGLRGAEDAPSRRPPVRVHFVREVPAPPAAAARPQPVEGPAGPVRTGAGDATPGAAEEQPAAPVPMAAPATDPAPSPAEAPPPVSPATPALVAPAAAQEAPPALPPAERPGAAVEYPGEAPAAVAVPADASPDPARVPAPNRATAGGQAAGGSADALAAPAPASPPREESPLVAPVTAATGTPGATAAGVVAAGRAAGGTDGEPAGSLPATGGATVRAPASGPTPQEIAGLRRRIDARKVYPQMAIRNGWEGRVLVEMHLDLEGRLAEVRLVASSGYAILDDATITAVRHASPFPPVARVVTVPVEYRLVP